MNNKGFAITGILYTLLILFLLLVGSFLGALRFKNNFLQKSIESLEDDFVVDAIIEVENDGIANFVTKCDGKYIFENKEDASVSCYAYLSKGVTIDFTDIKGIVASCSSDIEDYTNFRLSGVYQFEGDDICE